MGGIGGNGGSEGKLGEKDEGEINYQQTERPAMQHMSLVEAGLEPH